MDSGPTSAAASNHVPAAGDLRCAGGANGRVPVHFTHDGQPVSAYAGDTVAAALWAAGRRVLRHTSRRGEPRGLFCGMGVCFDCLVQIDGRPNVRACQTPVAEGMCVQTQRGEGAWYGPA